MKSKKKLTLKNESKGPTLGPLRQFTEGGHAWPCRGGPMQLRNHLCGSIIASLASSMHLLQTCSFVYPLWLPQHAPSTPNLFLSNYSIRISRTFSHNPPTFSIIPYPNPHSCQIFHAHELSFQDQHVHQNLHSFNKVKTCNPRCRFLHEPIFKNQSASHVDGRNFQHSHGSKPHSLSQTRETYSC